MNLVSFSPTFKLNIRSTKVGIRARFDTMQNVVNQRKKRSFKVEMFGTPVCSTSCSTKGGREPHFFAFLGKIKNSDFR